jgi:hypothetical protein
MVSVFLGNTIKIYGINMNKTDKITEAKQDIQEYLSGGGLFNPEMANHNEVRDLIIRLRTLIEDIERRLT